MKKVSNVDRSYPFTLKFLCIHLFIFSLDYVHLKSFVEMFTRCMDIKKN